jgi:fatty acid-binding protein DegV
MKPIVALGLSGAIKVVKKAPGAKRAVAEMVKLACGIGLGAYGIALVERAGSWR